MWIFEINGKRHPNWQSKDIYKLSELVDKWENNFKPYGITRKQLKEKEMKWYKKYGMDKANPILRLAWQFQTFWDDRVQPIKFTRLEEKAKRKFLRFDMLTKIRFYNTTQKRYADSFDF